ncbi:hypothetical protein [Sphingobacterium prati]|uniref:hypothetical protein n=1 Tax=Sphingobacterium prati TaxID=2737006 RepID=UPI001C1314D7|nr:hypothetical protein [Sphingobacterium prati]
MCHLHRQDGLAPLNNAPYTVAYEELDVFVVQHHYLEVAKEIAILPSLKVLLPESEFIKYAI